MALPKHTGPGALTRKECGYTAPSHEQLMEELKYIIEEMDGTLEVLDCYDKSNNWQKLIIDLAMASVVSRIRTTRRPPVNAIADASSESRAGSSRSSFAEKSATLNGSCGSSTINLVNISARSRIKPASGP